MQQTRHLADAADVLRAVFEGKAQVAIEAAADIIPVQQVGMRLIRAVQCSIYRIGNRRLAAARQAGEPQHHRRMPFDRAALCK